MPWPGVKDSAAVGVTQNGEERVQVALIVEPGTNPADVVKAANAQLADHQRIRAAQIWPGAELPRTEGHEKTETSRDSRVAADGRAADGVRLARARASSR